MKQYKIFRHQAVVNEAVKQGWSWPAFFFGFIWAMVKKQWILGFGVLLGLLLLSFISAPPGGSEGGYAAVGFFSFIIGIILGVNGNKLRERNLVSRGYEHVGTMTATSPEDAIDLYIKSINA